MAIRIIDLETTGIDSTDHVVEVGSVDLLSDGSIGRYQEYLIKPPCLSLRRVDEDVAILIPRRPGCAVFPLPVLHGRASLAGVCSSATRRSRKSRRWKRGLDSKYFSMSISSTSPRFVLASSAIRCRFVDRFVRLNVHSRVSRQRFSPHGTPLSSIGSR